MKKTYKNRKIITLTLVLATALTLNACSLLSDNENSNTASSSSRSNELSEPGLASSNAVSTGNSHAASDLSTDTSSIENSEFSQDEVSYDPNSVTTVKGVIIAGTRAMENYGGGPKSAATYAGYLNNFKTAVGENVNVYSMAIPIASAFYAPKQYKGAKTNHINTFASLRDNLSGVKDVNLLSALAPHTSETIYSRTDHHWQALGAYYASQELAKVAGVPFNDIADFQQKTIPNFLGSFYHTYTKSPILKNNPEDFVYYVPNQEYTANFYTKDTFKKPFESSLFFGGSSYSKFIGGDSYCVQIDTNVTNGRKLLVFKDSYGNALAPFLIGSFEQVYMVDIRKFKLNALDFIKEHRITDVCFSLSAFSIVNSNGAAVKDMNK